MGDASKASADALAGASLQTMSISTTGSLGPWKETEKWGGKPSEKKAYFAKINSQLKPHPQKMAMWRSQLRSFDLSNFARITHGFAVDRIKAKLRASGVDSGSIAVGVATGGRYCPPMIENDKVTTDIIDEANADLLDDAGALQRAVQAQRKSAAPPMRPSCRTGPPAL
mgnify:CR=1 FL=1